MSSAAALGAARPWAGAANPLGLTELDVASGVVLGTVGPAAEAGPGGRTRLIGPFSCPVPGPPPVEWPEVTGGPLEVLFDEAREILQRGRCVVAFSGGRDSSAVLATLLHVARRDGFDEPTALTARWPGSAATDESAWQEHVVHELGARSWEILTPGEDFDLLGPLARGLLRDHGLMWPAPTVALMPMIEAAGDGVLVTGQGGDEVFGTWSTAAAWASARRGRDLPWSLRPIVGAALPQTVRLRRALSRARPYQTWLTPEAATLQKAVLASEEVAIAPLWWPDYLREVNLERGLRLASQTQAVLCAARGGSFAAPLLAPAFLAALARRGGRFGFGGRTATMKAVFSPLLSDAILSRRSKANFGEVFWGRESRQFAREWDGKSLDPGWVDADALRAAWSDPRPVYGAALPLQAAWLAQDRSGHMSSGQGITAGEATPRGVLPLSGGSPGPYS